MPYLVAVHCGAGIHSHCKEAVYKNAMQQACVAAGHCLGTPVPAEAGTVLQAVTAGIAVLENAPCTNAGTGSNLTWSGVVQCDASIMAGDGAFGAVGAVHGLHNPIQAACALAEDCRQPLSCGRVRPMMLVCEGARQYAESRGLAAADANSREFQTTDESVQAWAKYRKMVQESAGGAQQEATRVHQKSAVAFPAAAPLATSPGTSPAAVIAGDPLANAAPGPSSAPPSAKCQGDDDTGAGCPGGRQARKRNWLGVRQHQQQGPGGSAPVLGEDASPEHLFDTVGCVVVDSTGRVAAGVSSGGIALKADGRVGEAAVYACGCWAQDGAQAAVDLAPGSGPRESAAEAPDAVTFSGSRSGPGFSRPGASNGGSGQQAPGPGSGDDTDAPACVASVRVPSPATVPAPSAGVAVSVSGVGEAVMRSLLAKEAALQLQARPEEPVDQVLSDVLCRHMSRPSCCPWEPRDCGILAVRVEHRDGQVLCELAAAHTSPSMGIAFSSATRDSTHPGALGAAGTDAGPGGEAGMELAPPAASSKEDEDAGPSSAAREQPVGDCVQPRPRSRQKQEAEGQRDLGSVLTRTRCSVMLRKQQGYGTSHNGGVSVWGKVVSWAL